MRVRIRSAKTVSLLPVFGNMVFSGFLESGFFPETESSSVTGSLSSNDFAACLREWVVAKLRE